MTGIPKGGIHCHLTWATIAFNMRQRAKTSSFLRQKMHPVPPKGGFVTNNRLMEGMGETYGGFTDAVPIAPAQCKLKMLHPFFDSLGNGRGSSGL